MKGVIRELRLYSPSDENAPFLSRTPVVDAESRTSRLRYNHLSLTYTSIWLVPSASFRRKLHFPKYKATFSHLPYDLTYVPIKESKNPSQFLEIPISISLSADS